MRQNSREAVEFVKRAIVQSSPSHIAIRGVTHTARNSYLIQKTFLCESEFEHNKDVSRQAYNISIAELTIH